MVLALASESRFTAVEAFASLAPSRHESRLFEDHAALDEVDRTLAKARSLLEKSKAKLAEGGDTKTVKATAPQIEVANGLPFFASKAPTSRDSVIHEGENGITTDGEKMAQLSEEEEWETKPISQVFSNEMKENEDVYSLASQQLASRDVAASIWDLRKSLQGEDYRKIFDKKNRFIGEDV